MNDDEATSPGAVRIVSARHPAGRHYQFADPDTFPRRQIRKIRWDTALARKNRQPQRLERSYDRAVRLLLPDLEDDVAAV